MGTGTDSDADPGLRVLLFWAVTFKRCLQKYFFLQVVTRLQGIVTSFFKDKKSNRSYKTVEITIFLHFLLHDGRIRILIRTIKLRIRMRIYEAQKHTDRTDLDPDADPVHC